MSTERIIRVPRTLQDADLESFFVRWTWLKDIHGPIVIDFSECDFVAPWVYVLYCSYAIWLRESRGLQVTIRVNPKTRAGHYACQLGLGAYFPIEADTIASTDEMRTSPLSRIHDGKEIQAFVQSVVKVLSLRDEEVEGAIHYTLVELLRNVVQHANSAAGGFAAAQYFQRSELVQVVVADCGVGLRATLEAEYPQLRDDRLAVRLAMLPHVSGTFAPAAYQNMSDNAGLGLFFIRQIAARSGGHLFLGSGSALADVWGSNSGEEKRRYTWTAEGWPGTFAVVQLRRNSIAEFGGLLAVCRDLAAEARKDPSKAMLDFIDEPPSMSGLLVVPVEEFAEDVEAAGDWRDKRIAPELVAGRLVILDFKGISFPTQSFIHALLYKVFRDVADARHGLSFARCSRAAREAIYAVSAYAKADIKGRPRSRRTRSR